VEYGINAKRQIDLNEEIEGITQRVGRRRTSLAKKGIEILIVDDY